jgi:hypothetical protein
MRALIICTVVFWLIVGFAFGQTSDYKLRFKKDALTLVYQNKKHKLNLVEQIDAARIEEASVLFAGRDGDFTYLVIDVSGMSKEKSDDRQCGAGVEANLIWLKLDAKWQIAAVDSVRYESCWASTTSDEGYKIDGKTLNIEIENFREDVFLKMSYNAEKPEKGFEKKQIVLDSK